NNVSITTTEYDTNSTGQQIDDVAIIHYAQGKPWNKMYSGRLEEVWYRYLQLSPYAYLYNRKYNTLGYHLLRTDMSKKILFWYIHLTPIINRLALSLLPSQYYD